MDPTIKAHLNDIHLLSGKTNSAVYLVGGTVRDHLLHRPCMDYDFTARQAPEIARAWAQKVRRTIIPLDETPGHETYRVVLGHHVYFDFTTLQGRTIEDDLAQRDFTINAMAVSLPDFIAEKINLIDPLNGKSDLHNKIIRMVSEQVLAEDPLRLLRAFRFASTLGFNIEPQTLAHIQAQRSDLIKVAQERITYELIILLGADRSNFDLLFQTGLLEILFPNRADSKFIKDPQTLKILWYDTRSTFAELEGLLVQPERFLSDHSQQIRDYLSTGNRPALIKWAALIRPAVQTNGAVPDITGPLKKSRLSNADVQFVARTLKFTDIVLLGARSTGGGFKEDSSLYQLIHRSGNELISSLLLSLAIRLGRQEDIQYFVPLIQRLLDFYFKRYQPAQKGTALLDGDALKTKFKLKPSPRFKLILDKVEEARVLGNIQTPEEAEQLAKELITSQVELTE